VPPIAQEPALAALRAADGRVKYTCYENGATEATARADGAVYRWFLEHRRADEEPPPDPLAAIALGLGEPRLEQRPARGVLVRALGVDPLTERTRTDQRLLYDRYRAGGRLADSPLEYDLPIGDDGTVRGTGHRLILPAPDGIKPDEQEPATTWLSATYRGDVAGIPAAIATLHDGAAQRGLEPDGTCRLVCLSGRLTLGDNGERVLGLQIRIRPNQRK
jgi:hypothetical protein